MAAAVVGNTIHVERVLKRGAKINDYEPIFGYTPLTLASWAFTGTIKFLISKGANVNARSTRSRMINFPLRLSRHFMATQTASQRLTADELMEQMEQTLAYLKSMPPHWTAFRSEGGGVTPLIIAAAGGSAMKVRLLLDKGANPNLATDSGETALMAAAYVAICPPSKPY